MGPEMLGHTHALHFCFFFCCLYSSHKCVHCVQDARTSDLFGGLENSFVPRKRHAVNLWEHLRASASEKWKINGFPKECKVSHGIAKSFEHWSISKEIFCTASMHPLREHLISSLDTHMFFERAIHFELRPQKHIICDLPAVLQPWNLNLLGAFCLAGHLCRSAVLPYSGYSLHKITE